MDGTHESSPGKSGLVVPPLAKIQSYDQLFEITNGCCMPYHRLRVWCSLHILLLSLTEAPNNSHDSWRLKYQPPTREASSNQKHNKR